MADDLEKKWKEFQIAGWKKDKNNIVRFFQRFNLDVEEIYNKITNQNYDKMQIICYLISKIEKAVQICDFLDELEKTRHDDVEVIKVFLLISHAEIAMNNFQIKGSKRELVNLFFKPVSDKYKLNYRIREVPKEIPTRKEILCGADVFYKIRNDYVHEGNYTGSIFRDEKSKNYSYNIFHFNQNGKIVVGECNLTYIEFINIFMEALIENIKLFLNR